MRTGDFRIAFSYTQRAEMEKTKTPPPPTYPRVLTWNSPYSTKYRHFGHNRWLDEDILQYGHPMLLHKHH